MRMKKLHYVILTFLIAITILYLIPVWTAITTAFKTGFEVRTTSPLMFSWPPTLEGFKKAWSSLNGPMVNSIIFTSFATIFSAIIGSINGYLLTKVNFKYADYVFLIITFGMFIPYQSILVPLVRVMADAGLYNSLPGLILTHTAYGIPICTLFFRNFYTFIPDSLIQAAKMDGAGFWNRYTSVVLPLSGLPFVVTGLYQFTRIWNNYLFGLVLTSGEKAYPVTVALANLKGSFVANYNVQMAGGLIVALPILALFIFLGRFMVRGFVRGAVK